MTTFSLSGKQLAFYAGWGGHYFFRTLLKKLFCGGKNNYSQLGLGHKKNVAYPVENSFDSSSQIVDISLGKWHTMFLLNDGSVLTFGDNDDGRCGHGTSSGVTSTPKRVVLPKGSKAISAGFKASYVVLESGEVFSFGNGDYGALALGDTKNRHTPTKIVHLKEEIKEVMGGFFIVVFISKQGNIFFAGWNNCGQQCTGNRQNQLLPVQLKYFSQKNIAVKNIALASGTVFFLTEKDVYAAGRNLYGEFGMNSPSESSVPVLCKEMKNVKEIYSRGGGMVVYRTKDDKFFTCGFGIDGCLGLGSTNDVKVPTEIPFLKEKNICQVNISFESIYYVSDKSDVYGCGQNDENQLPGVSDDKITTPKLLLENLNLLPVNKMKIGSLQTFKSSKVKDLAQRVETLAGSHLKYSKISSVIASAFQEVQKLLEMNDISELAPSQRLRDEPEIMEINQDIQSLRNSSSVKKDLGQSVDNLACSLLQYSKISFAIVSAFEEVQKRVSDTEPASEAFQKLLSAINEYVEPSGRLVDVPEIIEINKEIQSLRKLLEVANEENLLESYKELLELKQQSKEFDAVKKEALMKLPSGEESVDYAKGLLEYRDWTLRFLAGFEKMFLNEDGTRTLKFLETVFACKLELPVNVNNFDRKKKELEIVGDCVRDVKKIEEIVNGSEKDLKKFNPKKRVDVLSRLKDCILKKNEVVESLAKVKLEEDIREFLEKRLSQLSARSDCFLFLLEKSQEDLFKSLAQQTPNKWLHTVRKDGCKLYVIWKSKESEYLCGIGDKVPEILIQPKDDTQTELERMRKEIEEYKKKLASKFLIEIIMINAKTFNCHVNELFTVNDLKKEIMKETKIPVERQRLRLEIQDVFLGEDVPRNDDTKLGEYGISKGSSLSLILRRN